MLEVENLTVQANQRSILKDITCCFVPGKIYGILGENGAGKSTFFKALSHIWNYQSGTISFLKKNIQSLTRKEISQIFTLVPQHPSILFDFSVEEVIEMGFYANHDGKKTKEVLLDKTIKELDLFHLKNRPIAALSGGERQRVYLARSLITGAPVFLLDEPTAHLDLKHQLQIWKILKKLAGKQKTILAALHDLSSAFNYCDELIILSHGKFLFQGSPDDLLKTELIEEVFGVHYKQGQFFTTD